MINVETKKDAKTVQEFLNISDEKVREFELEFEGRSVFEIMDAIFNSDKYTEAEVLAIVFQCGFSTGHNSLAKQLTAVQAPSGVPTLH